MAEQFQNAKGNGTSTTYTCPSDSSALILGLTVKITSTTTVDVQVSGNSVFTVSLPAGTHNITHYAGKIVLAAGETINIYCSKSYAVISALRIY